MRWVWWYAGAATAQTPRQCVFSALLSFSRAYARLDLVLLMRYWTQTPQSTRAHARAPTRRTHPRTMPTPPVGDVQVLNWRRGVPSAPTHPALP